jgi:hypothetical protein
MTWKGLDAVSNQAEWNSASEIHMKSVFNVKFHNHRIPIFWKMISVCKYSDNFHSIHL